MMVVVYNVSGYDYDTRTLLGYQKDPEEDEEA